METNRKQYSEKFKKEAVEYYRASKKSTKDIARDLGIPYSNLKCWHTQYQKWGELAFPGHGKEKLTPQGEGTEGLNESLPIPRSSVTS